MPYSVLISNKAEKSLKKLPPEVYQKIRSALKSLKQNPLPFGSKKLKARDGYRLRVGAYRILYKIKKDELIILVITISHRKESYR